MAQAAQAANSLEKMLCHQMAAVHFSAMRLVDRSHADRLPPVDVVRLTIGDAPLIDVYQIACLMLLKLKIKGTQRVVVQYQQQVNVAKGGQALVAGSGKPQGRPFPPTENELSVSARVRVAEGPAPT
jgi:hypothetical protein